MAPSSKVQGNSVPEHTHQSYWPAAAAIGFGQCFPVPYPSNDNEEPMPPFGGAGALPLPRDLYRAYVSVAHFSRFQLYQLNTQIEDDPSRFGELVDAIRELNWSDINKQLRKGGICQEQARHFLAPVGFIASSLERHAQIAEQKKGWALRQVPQLRAVMWRLGALAGHQPRDSHNTYWIWNYNHALSFTGSPMEAYFNYAVSSTVATLAPCLAALRPYQIGLKDVLDESFVQDVDVVVEKLAFLRDEIFRGYFPRSRTSPASMTVEFFLERMRTYLVSYPVRTGQVLDGPNATYVASFPEMDFALGLYDAGYIQTVAKRLQWMAPEEASRLIASARTPSIGGKLLQAVDVPEQPLGAVDLDIAAGTLSESALEALKAYLRLIDTWSKLSKVHIGLIKRYVEAPAKRLSDREQKVMRTGEGVGGRPTSETRRIDAMRFDSELKAFFSALVKSAEKPEPADNNINGANHAD